MRKCKCKYGATKKTSSLSSLILHSVCASKLTRGNAYLRRYRGQLCASASMPSIASSRTTDSGWFLEMQTGPPEQLQTVPKSAEPHGDGVSTPLEVLLEEIIGCPIEHSQDVDGTVTSGAGPRAVGTERGRWSE